MENLTGLKFGKMLVAYDPLSSSEKCKCICDCGNECLVSRYHLLDGHTKSCGCLHKKFNVTNKRIFRIWSNMIDRCKSANRKDSKNYFLKGIYVCDEWKMYDNFEQWALLNGYEDNLTIDRIDFNGNYEPSNCRWITIQQQQRNKETTTFYTYDGETHCLKEWSEITGINRGTLWNRIHDEGLSIEEAINKKFRSHRTDIHLFVNGHDMSVGDVSQLYGINKATIYKYLSQGRTIESIIERLRTK